MGLSTKKPIWKAIDDTVLSLATKNIDENLISSLVGVKYVIVAKGNGLTKISEMLVANSSVGLTDTLYAKLGDSLDYQINAVESGLNMALEVINNESFTLTFEVKKLIL